VKTLFLNGNPHKYTHYIKHNATIKAKRREL